MSSPSADTYQYDLGKFSRKISTANSECQRWFDLGICWSYSFNHEEAVICYENAVAHDPDCAMAHWGVAFSAGPHYNKSWELMDEADLERSLKKTFATTKDAIAKKENGTPVEQALIEAIQHRYPDDKTSTDYKQRGANYANAMGDVYKKFGDDLDVAALYADALMNLTPWALWDLQSGKPATGARTLEAKEVLEKAFKSQAAWEHPGLLHSYVHLIEMSPEPEMALKAADCLRTIFPDAGHLCHMPSHLDILVGDYRPAIAANAKAIIADEKYAAHRGDQNFYTMYRLHDYHSLIYAALFAGQVTIALETVTKMEAAAPESTLRVESPPMADWNEVVHAVRSHVLIRFGRWDEIAALKIPQDQNLYCVTTASMHYAKAIAHAAQNNVSAAEHEQNLFLAAVKRVPSSRMEFPNKCVDTLAIATSMLAGELDYRRGNYESAFTHLQKAVDLDDALIYSEPWAWMVPTRHAFAALLLEQGHVEKAAALYRADLGYDRTLPRARQHPKNVWALHGYHECLRKMGKTDEADLLDLELKVAVAVADVKIEASCFCRTDVERVDMLKGLQADVNGAASKETCCGTVNGTK